MLVPGLATASSELLQAGKDEEVSMQNRCQPFMLFVNDLICPSLHRAIIYVSVVHNLIMAQYMLLPELALQH